MGILLVVLLLLIVSPILFDEVIGGCVGSTLNHDEVPGAKDRADMQNDFWKACGNKCEKDGRKKRDESNCAPFYTSTEKGRFYCSCQWNGKKCEANLSECKLNP
ncbi:hypothetical protein niasHT_014974 [Heterodera trifolii]|uniref:EGF-like domain-containing protein n=1 Tax=Heterodera trifolii TaxID=157864 RepID=A0ABD2L4Z7_9BILA